eukprot:c5502_g1_i1.p1 GENE.c5502_g1_i1~~c5502_g1_i1.p1  ORF type:complete len:186 (-),score=66.38 c5502_g1_i1:53-553(-)
MEVLSISGAEYEYFVSRKGWSSLVHRISDCCGGNLKSFRSPPRLELRGSQSQRNLAHYLIDLSLKQFHSEKNGNRTSIDYSYLLSRSDCSTLAIQSPHTKKVLSSIDETEYNFKVFIIQCRCPDYSVILYILGSEGARLSAMKECMRMIEEQKQGGKTSIDQWDRR